MARLAHLGEPTLTPARDGPGRREGLRIGWVSQVREAEDAAAVLRAWSVALAARGEGKAAHEALTRAEALLAEGPAAASAAPPDVKSRTDLWSKAVGMDYASPETQRAVVEAVAEMQRRRLEKEGRAAAARAKARRPAPKRP